MPFNLVITLALGVMGSMPKSLYVPTTYQEVVSQCLGSHHHILMPDTANKFLASISVVCFANMIYS